MRTSIFSLSQTVHHPNSSPLVAASRKMFCFSEVLPQDSCVMGCPSPIAHRQSSTCSLVSCYNNASRIHHGLLSASKLEFHIRTTNIPPIIATFRWSNNSIITRFFPSGMVLHPINNHSISGTATTMIHLHKSSGQFKLNSPDRSHLPSLGSANALT